MKSAAVGRDDGSFLRLSSLPFHKELSGSRPPTTFPSTELRIATYRAFAECHNGREKSAPRSFPCTATNSWKPLIASQSKPRTFTAQHIMNFSVSWPL
jgi:hypothetical protein